MNLKLKDVDLGKLVKSLAVKLDLPIAGKASLQVKMSIPTNRAADLKTYKVVGTAQVSDLVVAGVKMPALDGNVHYSNGVLELTALNGRFVAAEPGNDPAAGRVHGSSKLQVVPLGDLTADLTFDRIPVSTLAGPAVPNASLGGSISGRLAVRAPAGKLKNLDTVEGKGKFTTDRLSAYGLTLQDASFSVQLKDGVVRVPDLAGKLEGTPVTVSAELRCATPIRSRPTSILRTGTLLRSKNWLRTARSRR